MEGIRTDVRVCNLSLFNTDWYIDQMLRKAYLSDPLPITLPEEMYRNGSHDVTFLVEQESIKDYVEVKDLFDIIKKDEKKLQINTGSGFVDYFPTKKFRITVDPEAAIRSGTVPREQAGQIVNLEWRINRSALTKNYLMMLDILAHNNWERPVYYVTTSGSEPYIGLENYMQQEGFAYRLVPVRQNSTEDRVGGVNTAVMYDNLMNRFVFDMTKPGFLVSEDIFRMTVTMRSTYSRLAEALAEENRLDSAVAVCDRSLEQIPDRIVPYNYFNLPMAEVYLAAGREEQGEEILARLSEINRDQLAYYFRFPDDLRSFLSLEIRQSLAILHAVTQAAGSYGLEELATETDEALSFYYNLYTGQQFNP